MPEFLPSAWTKRPVAELGEVVTGATPPTADPGNYGGSTPFVTPVNLDGRRWVKSGVATISSKGVSLARILPPKAVLVSSIGILGKVGQSPFAVATNQQINAIVPAHGVDSSYLYHLAHRLRPSLEKVAGLQVLPIVNKKLFSAIQVVVAPLSEQRKIAEILDSIDEAIQKTEAIIAKLEQVKQGLLHDLLTRGIDDNGELRDPDRHPEQFKDSPLGRIPKAWEVRRIPSLFTTVHPGPRQDAQSCAPDGPVPVLDQSACGLIGSFQGPAGVRASEKDPVITFANHTCAVRWITFGCSAVQNVFFLRPAGRVSARFLFYTVAGRIPQASYQGHWPLLQELEVAVPSVTEQQQIACGLSELDSRSSLEVLELGKLTSLKQGLMEDLLTGRVRVTSLLDEAAK